MLKQKIIKLKLLEKKSWKKMFCEKLLKNEYCQFTGQSDRIRRAEKRNQQQKYYHLAVRNLSYRNGATVITTVSELKNECFG